MSTKVMEEMFGTADKIQHYSNCRAEHVRDRKKESASESNQIVSSTKCESEERISSGTNTIKKKHTQSDQGELGLEFAYKNGNAASTANKKIHNVFSVEQLFKKRMLLKDSVEHGTLRPETSHRTSNAAATNRVHSPVLTSARNLHTKASARLVSASQTRNGVVVSSLLAQAAIKWPQGKNKPKK